MGVANEQHARELANRTLKGYAEPITSLIVSESGDVLCNCDIEEECTRYEKAEQKYFLLVGERTTGKRRKKDEETQN